MRKPRLNLSIIAAAGVAIAVQTVVAVDVKVDFDKNFDFKTVRRWAWNPDEAGYVRMARTPDDDPDPFDGDAATLEYIYNGVSSGPLDVGNLENGFIDGTQGGFYVQNQPDDANPNDFSIASYANITIDIPGPATAGALGLLAIGAVRRRR